MGIPNEVEFKILEAKNIGSDTLIFRLDDGATVKVKVDVERAGLATNYKNPDGSPHYNISISSKITVIAPDKKYRISKGDLNVKDSTSPKSEPYT